MVLSFLIGEIDKVDIISELLQLKKQIQKCQNLPKLL